MGSENMSKYNYENELVYTQEQMDSILKGVKNMFGMQVTANEGIMLVSIDDYNEFISIVSNL